MGIGPPQAEVELHTPVQPNDGPLPDRCPHPGHVAPTSSGPRIGRCRVARVAMGGHLWFGVRRPDDGRAWLQIGPSDSDVLSAVCGHLWVSAESGGGRVLVENLSASVTLEIRSSQMPSAVPLYPVDVHAAEDRWLATPIAALQATDSTLVLVNRGQEFPVWARQRSSSWNAAQPHGGTFDVVGAVAGRADVAAAAYRIVLGTPEQLPILETFLARPEVRERLRRSESLRVFLAGSGNRSGRRDPDDWCQLQLERVRLDQATHELHRLILEGLGTPPDVVSKIYTGRVREALGLDAGHRPTPGAGGGPSEIAPEVRAAWKVRDDDLREYLGLDP